MTTMRTTTTVRARYMRSTATTDPVADEHASNPETHPPCHRVSRRRTTWPPALRPVGHEERLTLVGHLEELRTRLIICVAAIAVAFSVCYWQNDRVLEILNEPLETKEQNDSSKSGGDPLEQQARFSRLQKQAYETQARFLESPRPQTSSSHRARPVSARRRWRPRGPPPPACRRTPRRTPSRSGYRAVHADDLVAPHAALLLALPLIFYQVYAFLIPAFTPGERKVAVPIMLLVPFLFLAELAFGYFVVLERAIAFLQNFNDDNFDILVQASTYYKFVILFLGAIGLLFQIPVAVLAVTRTGILTTKQLRKGRGYAILGIAVLAAVATPTPDPVTMTLAMAPLILFYEASILLARWLDHVSACACHAGISTTSWTTTWKRATTIRRRSRSTGATTADRVTTERTDPPMLFDLRGKDAAALEVI